MLTALIWALLAGPGQADPILGPITVIDGDTIDVGAVRVRLYGIDAPEIGQPCNRPGQAIDCGRWVKQRTSAMYMGRWANCERLTTDSYGRAVARCKVAGQDIAARLVAQGMARAYRRYSMDYVVAETAASDAGLGIWRGFMQAPSVYRSERRMPARTNSESCTIKGNVSSLGKIYHIAGQRDYARTRISTQKGERWFCTETEALAAGWRIAMR